MGVIPGSTLHVCVFGATHDELMGQDDWQLTVLRNNMSLFIECQNLRSTSLYYIITHI